ncbi:MAG: hypothetical protein KIT35_21845 [Piscinibacter sp.]|uniref:DUF7210 family protein n=1 Tax=Piscinibacter sp. TaxID=1903157 RepID=UPI0025898D5A|nr:hypothetical protein [Piscinibacter sp.]MCW5666483.1 hypothetical protein [Piscinibacter sp.]
MATAAKKTAPKAEVGPKALYDVLSNLDHDGDRYEAGDQVELTEAQAALLPGVVKPAKAG